MGTPTSTKKESLYTFITFMFSRIYQSARALLTDSTQNRSLSPDTPKRPLQNSPEMVTSRSQSRAARRDDEVNDDNTIHVYVSSGQKRKLRSSGAGDTEAGEEKEIATPSAKKRKTLPVREKGSSPVVKNTIPVVEIPARKATPEIEAKAGTPAKPIEIEDDVEEKEVEVDAKTKHKRFDSEEAEEELFSTARDDPEAAGEVADSNEDSDSEDDAPEAIGIQDAAKEVKSKERDTAKAVKEQLTASRKKRKERDEILKKQSEKAKKRKPDSTTNEPAHASSESDSEDDFPALLDEPTSLTMPSHILTSRPTLPSFLPAEYLEDTEPQDSILTSDEMTIIKKKAKKTKFLDAALKEPKDRRVGKTTYMVAKAGSTKLAPKSSFTARSTKEAWMQGRSGGKVDPSRRAFGKAFGRR